MYSVCCSGRHRPNVPAWLAEQALCSPRCSSERSAGNLLHARTGTDSLIWKIQRRFNKDALNSVYFVPEIKDYTLLCTYRLVLKWTPKTKIWGRRCWRRSSTITSRWHTTSSRMAPASITLWVSVGCVKCQHKMCCGLLDLCVWSLYPGSSGGGRVHRSPPCCQTGKPGDCEDADGDRAGWRKRAGKAARRISEQRVTRDQWGSSSLLPAGFFQDSGGWTPIIWAAEHKHVQVIRALLNRGADVTIVDKVR